MRDQIPRRGFWELNHSVALFESLGLVENSSFPTHVVLVSLKRGYTHSLVAEDQGEASPICTADEIAESTSEF